MSESVVLRYVGRREGRKRFEVRHLGTPVGSVAQERSGGYSIYLTGRPPAYEPHPEGLREHLRRELDG